MSQTCLSGLQLGSVIFGAIFGTLLICAVFIVLLWRCLKSHQQNNKIFYVERAEKDQSKDVELGKANESSDSSIGHDSVDQPTKTEAAGTADPTHQQSAVIRQQSIVLNDKRHSAANSHVAQLSTAGAPKTLPNLGVTICKMPRSGFQIMSVEKVESRFVASDLVTELSINLDQMSVEDASALLELLVPYRIQLEVLRSNDELASPPPPPRADRSLEVGETSAEVHKEAQNDTTIMDETKPERSDESAINEEAPRPPSVSPPSSPIFSSNRHNETESQPAAELPPLAPGKRQSKTSTDDEQTSTANKARMATKIPTPKSVRSAASRSMIEPTREQNGTNSENGDRNSDAKLNGFSHTMQRDVLTVSNEQVDEFGLTKEQYDTLENNRRRLEREREALRDMGILS